MSTGRTPLLSSSHRAFIGRGVSMIVASSDAANRPRLARGCGCAVDDDDRVAVFVPRARAQPLIESVEHGRLVAAVFSDPRSHETIQLKGLDAEITPARAADAETLDRYQSAFVATLAGLGYPARLALALVEAGVEDAARVVFSPSAVFDQTPGPDAGRDISPGRP